MIIYNVTVNIDDSVHDEWLRWMRTTHIPDVLKTGLFTSGRIFRIVVEEEMGGKSYSIQYTCNSFADYERYEKEFAPALRAEHSAKYKDRFVAFRTLLEEV